MRGRIELAVGRNGGGLDFGDLTGGTAGPFLQLVIGMAVHPLRYLNLTHHHALARCDGRLKKRHAFFPATRGIVNEANGEYELNHVGTSSGSVRMMMRTG